MRNSPTACVWPYPLGSPSFRFTQQNDLVRRLDERFKRLTLLQRLKWQKAAEDWFWFAQCVPWVYDYDPLKQAPSDGALAYRGVNTTNVAAGLALSDIPPSSATAIDNDTVTQVGSVPTTIVWGGRSAVPAGSFVALLRVCALNHEPESGPTIKRHVWAGVKPINYGSNLSVSDVFAPELGYSSMPFVSLAVSISDLGGAPFVGRRVGFTAPY